MARAVRNRKLDTWNKRRGLAVRREPHWQVISTGCAIGYRRGGKGGHWIARWRGDDGRQHYQKLAAADDARDADGRSVLSYLQAQQQARAWFAGKEREQAGGLAPLDRPYTVADAWADYRADYVRRGRKAVMQLDSAANMFLPALGKIELRKLSKHRITQWLEGVVAAAPRVRTRTGTRTGAQPSQAHRSRARPGQLRGDVGRQHPSGDRLPGERTPPQRLAGEFADQLVTLVEAAPPHRRWLATPPGDALERFRPAALRSRPAPGARAPRRPAPGSPPRWPRSRARVPPAQGEACRVPAVARGEIWGYSASAAAQSGASSGTIAAISPISDANSPPSSSSGLVVGHSAAGSPSTPSL
jgi:hypothetical protein